MIALKATELIGSILAAKFGVSEVDALPSRTLTALGVDSLAGLELMFEVEERLGVRLPPELLSTDKTIAELASSLEDFLATQQ